MTFLPIVARELRVASRRRATYWLRSGSVFWAIAIAWWFFVMMQNQAPTQMGQSMLATLTALSGLYCLLSGVRATADCLSEEKREGTLGLLFLTDLKGYDVVLGKLVASSVNVFFGLLAILPVFALPALLGGVTAGEIGRLSLVSLDAMFFSLAVGVCVSAFCRNGRLSAGITFLVLIVPTVAWPLLGAWLQHLGKALQYQWLFHYPTLGFAYNCAFDRGYRVSPGSYWKSLLLIHSFGWAALILASFVAPRSWQDRPAGAPRLGWRDYLNRLKFGDVAWRLAHRRRLLDINPIYWLNARSRFKSMSVWIVLGGMAMIWLWGWAKWKSNWAQEGIYLATGLVLNALLKGWAAAEAGRQLAEDRQHGALELLVCTPLTIKEILYGNFLALRRQFLGPAFFVLNLWLLFMFATLSRNLIQSESQMWASFWLAAMLMLVVDLWAVHWVGLWQAMTASSPNRVPSATSSRVLLLPWLAIALVFLYIALAAARGANPDMTWRFFLGLWVVLGLATDFYFAERARAKLHAEFRNAAASRFQPGASFWAQFFGRPRV